MFVLQIFFHMFMGVSPIQYTSDDAPNCPSDSGNGAGNGGSPSSTASEDGSSGTGGSHGANGDIGAGAEPVFGEFKAFELSDSDLNAAARGRGHSSVRPRHNSRAARKRQRLQRQYVPEVLRSDVFGAASATGGGLVTSQALTSSVEREMMERDEVDYDDDEEEEGEGDATFQTRPSPTHYGSVTTAAM